MDEFEWVKSYSVHSYGTISNLLTQDLNLDKREPVENSARGSFASFICHVHHLERKLRSFSPIVLTNSSNIRVTDKVLGQGKTFLVRQASWIKDPSEPPVDAALKEIVPSIDTLNPNTSITRSHRTPNDWKDILFEIRALLHEPIRYHPNLVRLLGIQWGLSPLSESAYPQLLMECSSVGTLKALQSSVEPLPFRAKQTLCYDVARGLSALHAAGIVHGDMKHENVLIFANRSDTTGVKYIAKLADFGGSVMDMTSEEFRRMESWTWPFQAPEWEDRLAREGMMLTDVYSFGLLVWRTFLDGDGFVSLPGAAPSDSYEAKRNLTAHKATDDFTNVAIVDVQNYAEAHGIPTCCSELITYVILHTVRSKPSHRSLVKAQAALRGIKLGRIKAYLGIIQQKNADKQATEHSGPPGRHGITQDSLSFMLGRYGESIDLQDNLPGYRPHLDEPDNGEFLFEPEDFKTILTWEQQQQIVEEFKDAAKSSTKQSVQLLDMKKSKAAFYLFQCYLQEFGVECDPQQVVEWLSQAASNDDSHEDADYLAQAWLWRISRALGVDFPLSTERLTALLRLSVVRGHRTALQDLWDLVSSNSGAAATNWRSTYWQFRGILLSDMAAVGMGYFYAPRMTKSFDLENIALLDEQIRNELRNDFQACLKQDDSAIAPQGKPNLDLEKSAFDKIYLNVRGHGLLHYAAATGHLGALRHMITSYKCDINLPNQHVDETPLLCACAGGKIECAMFLIEHGADPNGWRYSQEGPLHWLCSFLPNEMETIVSTLVSAGADIELRSGGMRHDVRGIRADWEHILEIGVTPLGRAVLMNNIDAVRVLLKIGANPLARMANKHRGEWEGLDNSTKVVEVQSPFELAAVLTLPEILAEFINHIDGQVENPVHKLKLLDEASMLDMAHKVAITKFDPLTLQSRLVRCGTDYKSNMRMTIALLYTRARFWDSYVSDELKRKRSRVLCEEIKLGNIDIVECLLQLGYDANGTKEFRPLEKAIERNHDKLFSLLFEYKADVKVMKTTADGLHLSFLHQCGSRPHHSRPGSTIARKLIAAGIPVESANPRTKSPLSIAIANQNFDVAAALLENGANVDAIYPLQLDGANGVETRLVNVLVEVLGSHTTRTIESLRFLFGKRDDNPGPHQRPSFILDKSNQFSVLHLLAGSKQWMELAQITPSIVDLCLEAYSDPACINYRHPLLGTPLHYAAMNGHKPMVERLLRKGADTSNNAGPDLSNSVNSLLRPKESWTPLWAAILRYDEEINRCILFPETGPTDPRLKSNLIQNLEKIVELLSGKNQDPLAEQAMTMLGNKKRALLAQYDEFYIMQRKLRLEYRADPNEVPNDLSILSRNRDEKVENAIEHAEQEDWVSPEISELLSNLKL